MVTVTRKCITYLIGDMELYPYECQRKSEPGADELIRLEVIDYITDSTVCDVMKKRD